MKSMEICTFQAYREVYFLNIQKDYYYMLYPRRGAKEETGKFSTAVDKHFLAGKIVRENEEQIRKFLSIENIKKSLIEDKIIEYKYQRYEKSNKAEWCLVSIMAESTDVNGEAMTAIMTIRSIDKLIKHEDRQRHELAKAIDEARRANKAKTLFLSNMSHDMRTPLNAILGFANIGMKHIDEPEKVEDCFNKILSSGGHLLNLVNDILDMSSIESGKNRIQNTRCNIYKKIHSLGDYVHVQARDKGLSFSVEFKNIINSEVYADALKVNQIFINILSNAAKYTPRGGSIKFEITELEISDEEKARYLFAISDTGIGISENFIKHIFEPFEREYPSTESGTTGTGIGMAISKKLVDMLGGKIWVESKLGVGSTFYVELIFDIAKGHEVEEGFCKDDIQKNVYDEYFRGKKILLVEDNELNLEIAKDMLEDNGFAVIEARDGFEAIDRVKESLEGEISLILMDIQLPGINGYEATTRIYSLNRKDLRKIPVIAMTANAFEADREKAFLTGMSEHLSKPIDEKTLISTIKKHIIP